nr:response regulator transcription factor [Shuttleworthia satelles]
MYQILIVEDDKTLARQVKLALEKYGYVCKTAEDFQNIDQAVIQTKPDIILLDINLPRFDGFYWCRKIRSISKTPILILSARNESYDQVRGMESGADDYITKPFDLNVLLAKISATIRRNYGELKSEESMEVTIEKEGLSFYPSRLYFEYAGRKVDLTATESQLFSALLSSYPDAVSRDELFSRAWDEGAYVEENTLNVNVRRLRNKCKEKKIPLEIKSIRGLGYQLKIGGVD